MSVSKPLDRKVRKRADGRCEYCRMHQTSANVFTAHIVTQAIRDTGSERSDFSNPTENINTGLGFMDQDDGILGEQWSQVVIARMPGSGTDPETGGPKYDYRILYSRTLDHQAQ